MKAPSVQKCKKVIFTQIDPQRYVWRVAQNGQSDLPWVSSEPVTYYLNQSKNVHRQSEQMFNVFWPVFKIGIVKWPAVQTIPFKYKF